MLKTLEKLFTIFFLDNQYLLILGNFVQLYRDGVRDIYIIFFFGSSKNNTVIWIWAAYFCSNGLYSGVQNYREKLPWEEEETPFWMLEIVWPLWGIWVNGCLFYMQETSICECWLECRKFMILGEWRDFFSAYNEENMETSLQLQCCEVLTDSSSRISINQLYK